MIRKIHLAHCLRNDDWEAITRDLNHLPVGSIDGDSSKETIEKNYQDRVFILIELNCGGLEHLSASFFGVRKWQMLVFTLWRMWILKTLLIIIRR